MAPKVVTATDEQDLAKQLERAEQENAEVSFSSRYFDQIKTVTSRQVSGDDDDEDEEQVGMGGKISEGEESNEGEEED